MKNLKVILLTVLAVFLMSSECGRPDMLVINRVNEDGSVNRKLVITYDEDEFDLDDMQVPVDSTWAIEKTLDISEKGDSLWTLTAEKYFATVDELNYAYNNHKGSNSRMERSAKFKKKFRWFNTTFYFSEYIRKAIDGYPPEDFLEEEYLDLFYMPEKIFNDFRYGQDSLRWKAMKDSLEEKKELWIGRSLVRDAIIEIDSMQYQIKVPAIDIDQLWNREKEIGVAVFDMDLDKAIDSLLGEGYYMRNKILIDSSLSRVEQDFDVALDATTYLIQTKMPGELVATNGYIDTEGGIFWEVNGDVMLSKDYHMWAESTVTNTWAWIVSGLFILFVVLSIIIGVRRS